MNLALTVIRSVVTVALFALFVALCIWAWSARRRDDFAAAAQLPLDEDHLEPSRDVKGTL